MPITDKRSSTSASCMVWFHAKFHFSPDAFSVTNISHSYKLNQCVPGYNRLNVPSACRKRRIKEFGIIESFRQMCSENVVAESVTSRGKIS